MNTLVQDCMNGLELRDSRADSYLPVDFAVTSDAASMVLLVGWWKTADMMHDGGAFTYARPLLPGPGGSILWKVEDQEVVLGPTDDLQEKLQNNRDDEDFNRADYFGALLELRDLFPEFNFDGWFSSFQGRPIRDAETEMLRRLNTPRQMAKVYMLDGDGSPVDVLVIDEYGDAATATDDLWLSRAASDFANQKDALPPLSDYINWLADQQPYGGNALVGQSIFTGAGMLGNVATQLLSDRRSGI